MILRRYITFYIIDIIKSNLPWFVKDGRAIDKLTKMKEINRNRLVFAVKIEHPMLIRESVSKRELATVFIANFSIKLVLSNLP